MGAARKSPAAHARSVRRLSEQNGDIVRLALALLLLLTGCSAGSVYAWHRTSLAEPQWLNGDQDVEVWTHGRPRYWKAVTIEHDSVSGIPATDISTNRSGVGYYKEPDENGCKDCRRSVPLVDVDSIRLRGSMRAGAIATGVAMVGAALYVLVKWGCWGWEC